MLPLEASRRSPCPYCWGALGIRACSARLPQSEHHPHRAPRPSSPPLRCSLTVLFPPRGCSPDHPLPPEGAPPMSSPRDGAAPRPSSPVRRAPRLSSPSVKGAPQPSSPSVKVLQNTVLSPVMLPQLSSPSMKTLAPAGPLSVLISAASAHTPCCQTSHKLRIWGAPGAKSVPEGNAGHQPHAPVTSGPRGEPHPPCWFLELKPEGWEKGPQATAPKQQEVEGVSFQGPPDAHAQGPHPTTAWSLSVTPEGGPAGLTVKAAMGGGL